MGTGGASRATTASSSVCFPPCFLGSACVCFSVRLKHATCLSAKFLGNRSCRRFATSAKVTSSVFQQHFDLLAKTVFECSRDLIDRISELQLIAKESTQLCVPAFFPSGRLGVQDHV